MVSKAQQDAVTKYDKANTKKYVLKVNKRTERSIYDKLESVSSKSGYIKELITDDIKTKERIENMSENSKKVCCYLKDFIDQLYAEWKADIDKFLDENRNDMSESGVLKYKEDSFDNFKGYIDIITMVETDDICVARFIRDNEHISEFIDTCMRVIDHTFADEDNASRRLERALLSCLIYYHIACCLVAKPVPTDKYEKYVGLVGALGGAIASMTEEWNYEKLEIIKYTNENALMRLENKLSKDLAEFSDCISTSDKAKKSMIDKAKNYFSAFQLAPYEQRQKCVHKLLCDLLYIQNEKLKEVKERMSLKLEFALSGDAYYGRESDLFAFKC